MIAHTAPLADFFNARRQQRESLVLATIVTTVGSTYRKAGAQMLIAGDGQAAGLLSGGCAESDLIERAQRVLKSGRAELVEFDTRGSDDAIWGIGLGCEGAMHILLMRLEVTGNYLPYSYSLDCRIAHRRGAIALVVASENVAWPIGTSWHAEQSAPPKLLAGLRQAIESDLSFDSVIDGAKIFFAPVELPPRLLVLGAGADAVPVVNFASAIGWQVTVADHRPAYAVSERFTHAKEVLLSPAAELPQRIRFDEFDAAVVMSHHLPTDQTYLRLLAGSATRYVGLLGPPNRRTRLLAEIGGHARLLHSRLAGPVGLDIGAQTPEAIALAIVAEIHAFLRGREGGSFSGALNQAKNRM
ncbi:MAG TPA: XdhC family protein [Steroidobacteraceae bacterium]|nr:XdhC family protein [Steroidobacteraceae bacterium]